MGDAGNDEGMFGYKEGTLTIAIGVTVSGLVKVAIFTTNIDAESQCLINHKCVCGAMNRHFCQTRVSSSGSISRPFHCQTARVVFVVKFFCQVVAFYTLKP